jgi:DNA-binding NarL/FixJ family response regulator
MGRMVRVLIADDHQIVREGLITLLRLEPDIQIVGLARDGQEAVDLARRLRPDVVVMDVSMPRMDGVEATRIIRTEVSGTRVVGLSMHDESRVGRQMREAGAEGLLPKGGPVETLVAAIRGEAQPQSQSI